MTGERPGWVKWVALGAVALLACVTCLFLARWQWGRYHEHKAEADRITANYDAAPLPLADAFPTPHAQAPERLVWHPLAATGRYHPDATRLLRGRTVNTDAAYEVLVPFEVTEGSDAGTIWLIDRGYVRALSDGSAPEVPPPPSGIVAVSAHLQPFERGIARTPPPGQVYSITAQAATVAALPGAPVLAGYGIVASEQPAPAVMPLALPKPDIDYGNNLSYTMQWCVFAAAFPLGVVLLYRRDRQAASGRPRSPKRTGRAEAEEDAEVERQLT